jgi:hypothetical protein
MQPLLLMILWHSPAGLWTVTDVSADKGLDATAAFIRVSPRQAKKSSLRAQYGHEGNADAQNRSQFSCTDSFCGDLFYPVPAPAKSTEPLAKPPRVNGRVTMQTSGH